MFRKEQASEQAHMHPHVVTLEVLGTENRKDGTVAKVVWEL